MRKLPLIALVLVAFSTLFSCRHIPDGVLDSEAMAQLLADLYIGESVVEANSSVYDDSSRRVVRQAIYQRHGVTTADVDSSLRWYGYNMEKYVEVCDRTIEILNERSDAVTEAAGAAAQSLTADGASMSLEGDSVDVWNDIRFRPFASTLPGNHVPFILRYDSNWESGDIYTMRVKSLGNSRPVRLSVAISYSDGSQDLFSNSFTADGWHEAKFAIDTAKSAREVYGSLYYAAPDGEVAFIDSLTLTRTRHIPGSVAARAGVTTLRSKRHSPKFD